MALIAESECARIRQWGRGLANDISLRYATTGHVADGSFREFVERMAELAPRVRPKRDGDAAVTLPTLFLDRRVAYQALPLSRELEPFLTALGGRHALADHIAADVRQRLALLRAPALIKVYITPHCPYCPVTVALLLSLAAACDHVRLTVIDGTLFVDAAEKDRISAAPTVILDDRFRWTGSVDAAELVTMMLDRDPAGLGADALRGMIEDGDAEGVARMMIDRHLLFPAFFDLLSHPRWSVRLGAMVAFETLAELDPELAGQAMEPILNRFAEVDDGVKGDLLHVLGESGNPAALPFLETVAAGNADEEVRAAAAEAIDKLH